MKKVLFLFGFILVGLMSFADNWIDIKDINSKDVSKKLIQSNGSSTLFSIDIPGFSEKVQNIKGTNYTVPLIEGATSLLIKGAPDLLKVSTSIIIPEGSSMEISVANSQYIDYPNVLIAPSKGNLYRNQNPKDFDYSFGDCYKKNAFFPENIAELSKPYQLRDFQGQVAVVYPIQYNPVTKVLRVYHHLEMQISSKDKSFVTPVFPERVDDAFDKIYRHHFINYSSNDKSYTPVSEEGKMLVICPDALMSTMQEFVDWKNQRGLETEMVALSVVGNSATTIKNYVQNYYQEKGLTYLLLIGDSQYLTPGSTVAGPSDNVYGYLAGNDSYPEVFVGRFSVESVAQLQTQVTRTIEYEKNIKNGKWLGKGIVIGSTEGTNGDGDDGETDWQHQRNIGIDEANYTYNHIYEFFDGSQGGNDASGDPTATMLYNAVNSGAGVITYTGHGSAISFVTTNFTNNIVNQLGNSNYWPFIWSVACKNGDFVNNTCFAESWLRASKNGRPTGAVAALMATIDQSWAPPMCAQDEMVDILTEHYPDKIMRTFGAISMHGCMKMNDEYLQDGYEMTDTWSCFGDPSLLVRTDSAKSMIVEHDSTVPIGISEINVKCDEEGATVCISQNNKILGKGKAISGNALISIPVLTDLNTLTVTVSGYNKITFHGSIKVIQPNAAYVVLNQKSINDSLGNKNLQADFGEKIFLNLSLKNVGILKADSVYAKITTDNPNISLIKDSVFYGNISAADTSIIDSSFVFQISDNVGDGETISFLLKIFDNQGNVWNSNGNLQIFAPELNIDKVMVKDTAGNSNGTAEAGETIDLIINTINSGHSDYMDVPEFLSSTSPFVSILQDRKTRDRLKTVESDTSVYRIELSQDVPMGTRIPFTYTIGSGTYQTVRNFEIRVGVGQETWETVNFRKYNWDTTLFGSYAPWTLTQENPFEGKYSCKSGKITHDQISVLSIDINTAMSDSISFYKKTSCEKGNKYDYLEFLIDGVSYGYWDGNTDWNRVAFPISQGTHNLKWIYKKDSDVSVGDDCAWIDDITFPPMILPNGVEDPLSKHTFLEIYPNPAKNKFIIEIMTPESSKSELQIFNILGMPVGPVYVLDLESGKPLKQEIDISTLSKGVYFVRINSSRRMLTKKLLVD